MIKYLLNVLGGLLVLVGLFGFYYFKSYTGTLIPYPSL
jgi:hypothetical protein